MLGLIIPKKGCLTNDELWDWAADVPIEAKKKQRIESHLKGCSECQGALERFRAGVEYAKQNHGQIDEHIRFVINIGDKIKS